MGSAPLDMAKVGVSANDALAAWATSLLAQVLPTTLPAKWLHILVFDQEQKIGIAPIRVNPVGMLFAKGGKRRRADPRSGLLSLSIPQIGRFAEQTLLKPDTKDSVAYPSQLRYTVKGVCWEKGSK